MRHKTTPTKPFVSFEGGNPRDVQEGAKFSGSSTGEGNRGSSTKWVDLAKERAALAIKVKQVPKLETEVEELKQTIPKLRSIHQAKVEGLRAAHQTEVERLRGLHSAEIECKDTFCEAEKVRVLAKLQASYMAKLPSLYDEQFEQGFWVRYTEGERNAIDGPESSSEDGLEPTCSTEPVEPAREEARVLSMPTGEGMFKATATVISKSVIIIL